MDGSSAAAAVGRMTRWIQARSKRRPVGLTRMSRALGHWLPDYSGEITLEDGLRFYVDSRQPTERELLFVGDRHRGLTYLLQQHTTPGAYCLDLGANIGFYALKLAKWAGPNGHVTAFEANPVLVKRIEQNCALSNLGNVEIVPQAVLVQPANTIRFYISSNPELSSVSHHASVVQEVEVETTSIDAYIARNNWQRLDVIKSDIEGYDCAALLGGRKAIARWRPFIAFEYSYDTDPETAGAVFDMLAENGYTLRMLVLKTGSLTTFDWQQGTGSVNVICFPPGRSR